MSAAKIPRIILIDDDPIFCNLMAEVAGSWGVPLDAYESLLDLGSIGLLSGYDVAVIDYNLNDMTGIEIAEYLQAFFASTPMVLVSSLDNEQIKETDWPAPIAQFINKRAGCRAILLAAMALSKFNDNMEESNESQRKFATPGHIGPVHTRGVLSR